mgnify:CR=1 FL=1
MTNRTRALRDKECAGTWAGGGDTTELDKLHKAGPKAGAQAATSALAGPEGKRSGEEEASGTFHVPPIGRALRASAREKMRAGLAESRWAMTVAGDGGETRAARSGVERALSSEDGGVRAGTDAAAAAAAGAEQGDGERDEGRWM